MILNTLSVRSVILVPFEEGAGVLLLFALQTSRNDAGKQRGSRVLLGAAIVQHFGNCEIAINNSRENDSINDVE